MTRSRGSELRVCSSSWRTMSRNLVRRVGSVWRLHSSSCSRPRRLISSSTKVSGWKSIAGRLNLMIRQVLSPLHIYSSPADRDHLDSNGETILPAPLSPSLHDSQKMNVRSNLNDRRRIFKQIIVKCVLQLLLIETTNDLLRNSEVYSTIPPEHLLRLMGVLDHSYQFARMFNEDKELRTGLWRVGM